MRLRLFAAGLLPLFASAGVVLAQPGPLEREIARRQIADQEAEAMVKDALAQGEKLARTHPEKAVRDLQRVRFALAARADVSSAKQTDLLAALGAAIASANRAGTVAQPLTVDPKVILRNDANRKAYESAQLEAKEVSDIVAAIAKDETDGRLADARAKIAQLNKKYPLNPASSLLSGTDGIRKNLADAKSLSQEQGRRFALAMNDVQKSALAPIGDMEFPPDWVEKSKKRKAAQQVLLGEEETALLQALEKPISVPLRGVPFEEAVQTLSNTIGKNLYIDKQSMDNLGIDLRKPVDVTAGVNARTALRGMLQSIGMTFVIRDKTIQLVSMEKARENMMTRSYEIRDLVQTGGPFNGGATWGPYIDFQQTMANADNLIKSITMSIDPQIWKNNSGPGVITFHYPSMSIVVRAPSEVHYSLGQAIYGPTKKK